MNILDNLDRIEKIDSQGMLEVEEKFYYQLLEARDIVLNSNLRQLEQKEFRGIAFLGMGGSGFTGDIIKALIEDDVSIPVEIVKGYNLPAFIKRGWLAVGVSYSGNTEETISAVRQALECGCEVLTICSGGKIENIARDNNKAVIKIPSGLQPRGAIGYLFIPAYLALDKLNIITLDPVDTEEAFNLIKEKSALYQRETETDKNPAKKLALKVSDRLPIIYGTEGLMAAIAYRLKCEFNENSKTPCWYNEFPELNHNETVGWERLKSITRKFILLILRDKDEKKRLKTRIEVTSKLIRNNISDIIEIPVEGRSKLAKALSSMYLGDTASVYLAILAGIDPSPVRKINLLKSELKKLDDKI
jgi:glucose/mannose-6-phosphate isomerase